MKMTAEQIRAILKSHPSSAKKLKKTNPAKTSVTSATRSKVDPNVSEDDSYELERIYEGE